MMVLVSFIGVEERKIQVFAFKMECEVGEVEVGEVDEVEVGEVRETKGRQDER